MKKHFHILLLSLLYLLFFTACEDDEPDCTGIDCLPEATRTGAGTFGCLVNGEAFVDNSGRFNCFYQLVDGEYYFNISADFGSKVIKDLSIASNAKAMSQGETYLLLTRDLGNYYAEATFDYNPPTFLNDNSTEQTENPGILEITNFDIQNNIVSGNFHFQITDTINNEIYQITEGRFDARFTR
jgi:hypothetical protein